METVRAAGAASRLRIKVVLGRLADDSTLASITAAKRCISYRRHLGSASGHKAMLLLQKRLRSPVLFIRPLSIINEHVYLQLMQNVKTEK